MVTKSKIESSVIPRRTLADVSRRLQSLSGEKWASEQRSALRTLSRVAGTPLDLVNADRRTVADLLNRCLPSRHGVSRKRWRNVRSLAVKALENVDRRRPWRQVRLSANWETLLVPLPEKRLRLSLVAFARFCSATGIEPDDVTEATFSEYEQHLQERSLRSSPRGVFLGLCRAWSRALADLPHWPKVRPVIDNRRNWHALPWSSFPAALKADVDAFLEAGLNPDPLANNYSRPLRTNTARGRERAIRAFASALVERGRDPKTLCSLADLVEPGAARAGLQYFIQRMRVPRSAHLRDFARLLVIIARHWVYRDEAESEPERTARERHIVLLNGFRRNLAPERAGMTSKNRAMLRQLEDNDLIVRLVQLPEQIWSRYPDITQLNVSQLVKLQSALAIAILTTVPIRRKNLLQIELGKHLIVVGPEKNRRMHLHFEPEDVKNNTDIEFELPAPVVRLLDRFLTEVRPRLLCSSSPHLFVGSRSAQKINYVFSNQIANLTASELGVRLTPHQFRHFAGFVFLKDNPGGHELVRRLLGHKSIQTTLDSYAGMETAEAHRHFDRLIETLRGKRTSTAGRAARRRPGGG
jgi:integrase